MFLYYFCCLLIRFVMLFVFRLKAVGRNNIPAKGGAILAVNHRSNWDVVIAGLMCPRMLRFMAKAELFENKLFGGLIKRLGAFPVQRGRGDVGAIKSALNILSRNHVMLMFPEGHRMKNGKRAEHAKPGVSMIAAHAGVPVIPVYIDGEYKWMHKITVIFGEPITYEEYAGKKLTSDELQQLSDNVLKTIYALEPAKQKER